MDIKKFEEKVAEFALEQGWIPNEPEKDEEYSLFFISVSGHYKRKSVKFWTECENEHIHFELLGSNYDDLFEKAFRLIKASVKNTRAKKEIETV